MKDLAARIRCEALNGKARLSMLAISDERRLNELEATGWLSRAVKNLLEAVSSSSIDCNSCMMKKAPC